MIPRTRASKCGLRSTRYGAQPSQNPPPSETVDSAIVIALRGCIPEGALPMGAATGKERETIEHSPRFVTEHKVKCEHKSLSLSIHTRGPDKRSDQHRFNIHSLVDEDWEIRYQDITKDSCFEPLRKLSKKRIVSEIRGIFVDGLQSSSVSTSATPWPGRRGGNPPTTLSPFVEETKPPNNNDMRGSKNTKLCFANRSLRSVLFYGTR